jgi:hypothetical protein
MRIKIHKYNFRKYVYREKLIVQTELSNALQNLKFDGTVVRDPSIFQNSQRH